MQPGDPSHLLGKVIDGRYEILQCIGEGGMGVVYKARQTSIDRMVAVKMLSSNLARDRNWVQRFYNEAKACSRLHHPNTIRMFDFGQTREGQLFMAMEFLDGLSLRQVIGEQAPMDAQRVLKVLMQCCASLSEAHNLGIIHRDIKADNVFLIDLPGSRDHVKLLDFGVAKLMMAEDFATQVGVVFGTPQYMSPEQGRGEPLTPRSDLYGVGILAYEMLTGSVPFSDPVPMNVLQMQMQSAVPPLPPRVPAAVQRVVMRALEKDPARRYATASAMMEEAQAVLTSLQSGAFRPSGQVGPVPAHGTPDAFPSVPGAPEGARTLLAGSDRSPAGLPSDRTMVPQDRTAVPPDARQSGSRQDARWGPGMGAGPPPVHMPPPEAAPADGAASMPTVLDRPNPLYDSGRGQASPVAAAAASARTILVSTSGQVGRQSGPQGVPAGPAAAHLPYPPGPGPGMPPDQRTVMLANSEGIVSMAPGPRPMPATIPDSRGGPVAFGRPRPAGASAMFWILCLLTGLAVGIGAYWLVLELGR